MKSITYVTRLLTYLVKGVRKNNSGMCVQRLRYSFNTVLISLSGYGSSRRGCFGDYGRAGRSSDRNGKSYTKEASGPAASRTGGEAASSN